MKLLSKQTCFVEEAEDLAQNHSDLLRLLSSLHKSRQILGPTFQKKAPKVWPLKKLNQMKQYKTTEVDSSYQLVCLTVESRKDPKPLHGDHSSLVCAHQTRCCLHRWRSSLIISESVCGWVDVWWLCSCRESWEKSGDGARRSGSTPPFLEADSRSGWFADEPMPPWQFLPRRETNPSASFLFNELISQTDH